MAETILTQYQNVKNQIVTFKISMIKLTFSINVRDRIYSLPNYLIIILITRLNQLL